MGEVKSLTSIRGIAAIFVMLGHLLQDFQPVSNSPLLYIGERGGLGVDMFFILSGFILAYVYHQRIESSNFVSFYKQFVVTRFLRIYPLHISAILVLLITVTLFPQLKSTASPHFFDWNSLIANVFLVQSWGFTHVGWNLPSWSLSAEWAAYLGFPLMLLVLVTYKTTKLFPYVFLATVIYTSHIAFVKIFDLNGFGGIGFGGMFRCAFEFTLGVTLYEIKTRLRCSDAKIKSFSFIGAVGILLSIAFEQLVWVFIPSTAVLIIGLSYEKCSLNQVLSTRIFHYLGLISFSLYIWHAVVMRFIVFGQFVDVLPDYSASNMPYYILVYLVTILVISHYSYKHIEFAFYNLRKKLYRQKKAA